MSFVDAPAFQRAVRIPLGVFFVLCALGCLALAPISFGFTIPPGLIVSGLAGWMFAPPDEPPPRAANLLVGWGTGLLVAGIVALVVANLVYGAG
jgi:hypothetical protein